METHLFYYEFESADNPGEIYGGFLSAENYTHAMRIIEHYAGNDLKRINTLELYGDGIMCLPAEYSRKIKTIL